MLSRASVIEQARLCMFTLTYKGVKDWRPGHMQRFQDWLVMEYNSPLNVWVMELQKRGAPHYHCLVLLGKGQRWKNPQSTWGWPYGITRVTDNIHSPFYIMKYLQKGVGDEKEYPPYARIFGRSRRLVRYLSDKEYRQYTLAKIPGWARRDIEASDPTAFAFSFVGGVWYNGWRVYSPYSFIAGRIPENRI